MGFFEGFATSLIGPITELVGKFVRDKDDAARLAAEIASLAENHAHAEALGQMEINKAEARTGSRFIGGWRPAVGWIAAIGLGVNYLFIPVVGPFLAAYTAVEVQPADMMALMPILAGMLGLRTYEKRRAIDTTKL